MEDERVKARKHETRLIGHFCMPRNGASQDSQDSRVESGECAETCMDDVKCFTVVKIDLAVHVGIVWLGDTLASSQEST
jgi:hypothetical protein